MTGGVVDAVAAAALEPIARHLGNQQGYCLECDLWMGNITHAKLVAGAVAEAVAEALALTEEWTWSWPNGSAPGVPGFGFSVDTREEAELEGSNIVCRVVSPWVSVVRGTTQ